MLSTLRNRLILSHILPVLIVIPLAGIALFYLIETQFLLPISPMTSLPTPVIWRKSAALTLSFSAIPYSLPIFSTGFAWIQPYR